MSYIPPSNEYEYLLDETDGEELVSASEVTTNESTYTDPFIYTGPSDIGAPTEENPDPEPIEDDTVYLKVTYYARETLNNYDPYYLEELYDSGAKFYAIYDDDTEEEVSWTEIQDLDPLETEIDISEAIASASNQHFWNDTNGVHVSEVAKEDWNTAVADNFSDLSSSKNYYNIIMNSLGLLLRRAPYNLASINRAAISFYDGLGNDTTNIMASFGRNSAQIGRSSEKHVVIDNSGLTAYNSDGTLAPLTGTFDGANINNSSITNTKIVDGTIEGTKIASATIDNSNIKNGTITGAKIADGTIENADIKNSTITGAKMVDGTIEGTKIASATIDNSNIKNGTIEGTKIASATIDNSNIKNGTIEGTKIASATIDNSNIKNGTITGAKIADGTIENADIKNGTITGTKIAASTIENSNIKDGTIQGSKIVGSTLTGIPYAGISDADIEVARVANAEIAKAEVNYAHITNGVIDNATIDHADVNGLSANYATVANLNAATARIDDLEADHVSVSDFEAEQANIDQLQADTADIDEIRANSAKVENLTAAQLEADHATVGRLSTTYATIANLNAATGRISDLESTRVRTTDLEANYITADAIEAAYTKTDLSNTDVAWIQNGTIKNGAITNAMINSVSANKLTAGTIDASVINVTNLQADDISVTRINGQTVSGKTLVDALEQHEDDISDLDTKIDTQVEALNDRIDGAIETFTGTAVPTLTNSPASSWNTTKLKDQHVGDVYYVVNSSSQQNGYCYRFTKSGSSYSWQLIKDSDVTAALSRLLTAEGKISTIEQFDSDISSWKTDTDDELASIKSAATTLAGRVTTAEGQIATKVETSTFNTLSQTVDENSASISQLTTETTTLTSKVESQNPFIVGTQTAQTGNWTGNASTLTSLVDGQQITYWLPFAPSGNASLNLTLKDGTTTGAIPCYYSGTSRLTTHYAANNAIHLTYRTNISGIAQGWWADANYDTNTTYSKYSDTVVAGKNGLKRYTLCMRDDAGNFTSIVNQANNLNASGKTCYTGGLQLGSVCYHSTGGDYAAGANAGVIWESYGGVDFRYSTNGVTNAAATTELQLRKPIYLVGTIGADGLFYLDTTKWWTQTSFVEDKAYVFVGTAYSSYYAIFIAVDNPTYIYEDGELVEIQTLQINKTTTKINTVSDTVDEHTRKIGLLETSVESKADGSTVETMSTKLNTVSDTVDGHTQSISSINSTLSTKADSSTVSTLSTKVNTIEDTVDGHTQSLQSVTSTQTSIQQNAVKSTVQLWFTKANTTAPNKPTAHVITNNAATGNAWNLAVPTYNASYPNYYYCYEYQYLDGSYGWSAVTRDIATGEMQERARTAITNAAAAQADIDGLEIGGRNYILNSAGLLGGRLTNGNEYISINVGQSYMDIPAGTQVTLSFDLAMIVSTSNWDSGGTHPYILVYNTNNKCPKAFSVSPTGTGSSTGVYKYFKDVSVGDTIQTRVNVTGYINDRNNPSLSYNCLEFYSNYDTGNFFTISNLKMEIGNKATDWTPAPEDVDADISTAQTAADTAQATADKNIKESIQLWITKASSSAPAKPTSKVTSTAVSGNAWTTKVPTYNSTYPYYFYCIQYIAADGTVTWSDVVYDQATTEAQSVARTATTNLSTLQQDYATFKQTTQNFESTIGSTYATKTEVSAVQTNLDNLEIGGRNLLPWSLPSADNMPKVCASSASLVTEDGYSCYKIEGGSTNGSQYGSASGKAPVLLEANTQYVYSAIVKVTTTTSATSIPFNFSSLGHFSVVNSASTSSDKTHEDILSERVYTPSSITIDVWTKIQFVFITNALNGSRFGLYPKYALGSEYTVFIRNQKLEKGNKATDWTPAPEDQTAYVDGSIDNLQIGGRNLLRNTNWTPESVTKFITTSATYGNAIGEWRKEAKVTIGFSDDLMTITVPSESARYGIYQDVTLDPGHYILSADTGSLFKAYVDSVAWPSHNLLDGNSNRASVEFDVSESAAYRVYISINNGQTISGNFLKLEKSNKATDWTPAPEDVDSAIQSIPRMAKINMASRNFTTALWKTYGTVGRSENWSTGSSYDNSHLRIGDRAYITGTISDKSNGTATIIGEITNVQPVGSGTNYVTLKSEQLIFGGDVVDAIESRVTSAETSITQNNEAIALKANASDVYTKTQTDGLISTEVSNRNSAIEQSASAINLSVSQTYSTKTEVSDAKDYVANAKNNYGYQYKKDIVIYGDSDKYYPVYFTNTLAGSIPQTVTHEVMIMRGYSEQAPADWNTATHKGSLNLHFGWNYGGWGGATYKSEIYEFTEMYSTILGDILVGADWGVFSIVFLRGGGSTGALYHIYSQVPFNQHQYMINAGAVGADDVPYVGLDTTVVYAKSGDTYQLKVRAPLAAPNTEHLTQLYTTARAASIESSVSDLRVTADGISSEVSKISSIKHLTSTITNGWTLSALKSYATDGQSTTFNVTSTANVRVGDTVYIKGTDSTRKCPVYIKATVTQINSATQLVAIGHGYSDSIPVDSAISSINQSAETIKIQASRVEIDGTAIFNSISSSVDSAITDKGYATTSQAQSYATTAKNEAISAAASDATSKANTAKSEAISAAASDATSKANTAKSEAISAAASDATTKANAVQTNLDNLEIGGRNLLAVSDRKGATAYSGSGLTFAFEDDGWISVSGTSTASANGVLVIWGTTDATKSAYDGADYYTITIEDDGVLSNDKLGIQIYGRQNSANKYHIEYAPGSYTYTDFTDYISRVCFYFTASSNGLSVNGRVRLKLEKGNKPTDWTPAPEDQISTAVEQANAPLQSKRYTGIIGTENSFEGANFFFGKLYPDSYDKGWQAKLRIECEAPNTYQQSLDITFGGYGSTFSSYDSVTSLSASRAFYYVELFKATSAGITANAGHMLGISLQSATNPANSSYARTIRVDVLSTTNCSIVLNDGVAKYSAMAGYSTTNYGSGTTNLTQMNIATAGQNATNNVNTNDTARYVQYYNTIVAGEALAAASLIGGHEDGKFYQISGTSDYFILSQPLLWLTTALSANATNYANIYTQCYDRNLSTYYSSFTNTLPNKIVYLVGTIDGNKFTVYGSNSSTYLTVTEPTTADGRFYIPLGRLANHSNGKTYFNYQVSVPVILFAFIDGKFRQVNPTDVIATQKIYYRTASTTAPTPPTSWVTTNNAATYNAWNLAVPPLAANKNEGSTKYAYLYSCEQRQRLDGTVSCGSVSLDSNTTIIDGGQIITNSITALQIAANSITATEIDATNLHVSAANVDGTLTIGKVDGLQTALDNATDAISTVQDNLDNLKIGGRNLLPYTTSLIYSQSATNAGVTVTYDGDGWFSVSGSPTSGRTGTNFIGLWRNAAGNYASPVNNLVPQEGGVELAYSVETEGTPFVTGSDYVSTTHVVFYGQSAGISVRVGGFGSSDINKYVTAMPDFVSRVEYYVGRDADSSVVLNGRFRVKLENGNRVTDWTPAPEDQTSYVDNSINSLEIGGRNLLRNTSNPTIASPAGYDKWSVGSGGNGVGSIEDISDSPVPGVAKAFRITGNTSGNRDFAQFNAAIESDLSGVYRFSAWVRGIGGTVLSLIRSWNNTTSTMAFQKTISVGTTWTRIDMDFDPDSSNNPTAGDKCNVQFGISGAGSIEYIAPKLEKGNKATDWTLAPEDQQDLVTSTRSWYATCDTAAATVAKVATTTDSGFDLHEGVVVDVKFTNTNSGAVGSLTLNVNSTGAKSIKTMYNNSLANLTTAGQLYAGLVVRFVYSGTYWIAQTNYNSDTYNRTRWQNIIKVLEKPTGTWRILCGTESGYKQVAASVAFDLAYPLLALSNQPDANTNADTGYISINSLTFSSTAAIQSGAANKTIYLKGSVSGNTFTIDATNVFTTVVPTSEDGKAYIPLGIMTSATVGYFKSSKDLYAYKDGAFGPISIREASAAAKTATNYITADANGIKIHMSGNSTTYQHQTASGTTFYVNGKKRSTVGADGLTVYIGDTAGSETDVASFGTTARIGSQSAKHLLMRNTGVTLMPANGESSQQSLKNISDFFVDQDTYLDDPLDQSSAVLTGLIGKLNNLLSTPSGLVYSVGDDDVLIVTNAGAQIGRSSNSHLSMDYHSLQMIDKEGNTYFHVSDLRGTDGTAEMVAVWKSDGTTTQYTLSVPANNTSYSLTVSDSSGTISSKGQNGFSFSVAPNRGATITATYTTDSRMAKALSFGIRYGSIGAYSVIEGAYNEASGTATHAEGNSSHAAGFASHAEGRGYALGDYSHAESGANFSSTGALTTGTSEARGRSSHAEGGRCIADGDYSHAEGRLANAEGLGSHAEGSLTTASGDYSHAQNYGTSAAYDYQTAIGKYNNNANNAFEIGNGTSDNHSNALAVDWSGNLILAGGITLGTTLADSNLPTKGSAGTAGTSSATSGATLAVPYITTDAYGRVTAKGTHTHTINSLAASAIGSGTFDIARIPTITTAKGGTGVTAVSTGTITYNTTNVTTSTSYAICRAWGIVATVQIGTFKLKSQLAAGGTVEVATLPSGFRPISHTMYFAAHFGNSSSTYRASGKFETDGTVSLVNQGPAIPTSAVILVAATYCI